MTVYHSSTLADGFTGLCSVVYVEQVKHSEDFIGNYAFHRRSSGDEYHDLINTIAVFVVKPKKTIPQ